MFCGSATQSGELLKKPALHGNSTYIQSAVLHRKATCAAISFVLSLQACFVNEQILLLLAYSMEVHTAGGVDVLPDLLMLNQDITLMYRLCCA